MSHATAELCLWLQDDQHIVAGWRRADGVCGLTTLATPAGDATPAAEADSDSTDAGERSATPRIDAALKALAALELGPHPRVCLALASQQCYCGSVQLDDTLKKAGRAAWDCQFEAKLPVPLEALATHYRESTSGRQLAVATPLEHLTPWVDQLEQAGYCVDHIAPAAPLALAWHFKHSDAPPADQCWLLQTAAGLDRFQFADGVLESWRFEPSGSLDAAALGEQDIALNAAFAREQLPFTDHLETDVAAQAVLAGGLAALHGELPPWWDLREYALITERRFAGLIGDVKSLCVAAAVGLLLLAGVMQWRSMQLDARADAERRASIAAYRQYAGERARVPAALASHMEALVRQRIDQASLASVSDQFIGPDSALDMLVQTLSRIPGDRRWMINDLDVTADRFDLDGQARGLPDVGHLAKSLAKDGRLRVSEPQTRPLHDSPGVGFNLSGTWHAPPPAPGSNAPHVSGTGAGVTQTPPSSGGGGGKR